jgi:TPR repeat protein
LAVKYIRQAKTQKHSTEIAGAEVMYQQALALAKRGRKGQAQRALPLLRAAADAGHAMAAHALATWYIHGIGVRKNFRAAVALERIAARAGIVEAIFNLAFAHEMGRGTQKDTTRALRLYRSAAAKGDRDAMYEVGRCVFYGIGTDKNERLGRKWIERAECRDIADGTRAKGV